MAIYDRNELIQRVNNDIYQNAEQLITGQKLHDVLIDIVDSVSLTEESLWERDSSEIWTKDESLNINLQDKGLTDTNILNDNKPAILLSDSSNTEFTTANKTFIGSVNELNSNKAEKNLSNVLPNDILSNLNNATGDITINTIQFSGLFGDNYLKIISDFGNFENEGWHRIFKFTGNGTVRISIRCNLIHCTPGAFEFVVSFSDLGHLYIHNVNNNHNSFKRIGLSSYNGDYYLVVYHSNPDIEETFYIYAEKMDQTNSNSFILEKVVKSSDDYFPLEDSANIVEQTELIDYYGYYTNQKLTSTILEGNTLDLNPIFGEFFFNDTDQNLYLNTASGWRLIGGNRISDGDSDTYIDLNSALDLDSIDFVSAKNTGEMIRFRNGNGDVKLSFWSEGILKVDTIYKTDSALSTKPLILGQDYVNISKANKESTGYKIECDGVTRMGGISSGVNSGSYSEYEVNEGDVDTYSSKTLGIYTVSDNDLVIKFLDSTFLSDYMIFYHINQPSQNERIFFEVVNPSRDLILEGYFRKVLIDSYGIVADGDTKKFFIKINEVGWNDFFYTIDFDSNDSTEKMFNVVKRYSDTKDYDSYFLPVATSTDTILYFGAKQYASATEFTSTPTTPKYVYFFSYKIRYKDARDSNNIITSSIDLGLYFTLYQQPYPYTQKIS